MNRLDNEENVKLKSDTQTYHHRRDNRKNNTDDLVTYCFVQLTTRCPVFVRAKDFSFYCYCCSMSLDACISQDGSRSKKNFAVKIRSGDRTLKD